MALVYFRKKVAFSTKIGTGVSVATFNIKCGGSLVKSSGWCFLERYLMLHISEWHLCSIAYIIRVSSFFNREIYVKEFNYLNIFVIVCVFLFTSCGQELDTEKSGSATPSELLKGNNNDQGEDEGNRKKPPVVNPPEEQEEQPPFDIAESEFYVFGPGHLLQLPGSFTGLSPAPRRGSVIKSKAQMDASWVSVDPQSDWVQKKYNENFFSDFNLVVVSLFLNHGRLEVDSVTANKKELHIFLDYMRSPLAVMATWTILIPIGKEHFDGDVDDINIVNK